MAPQSRERDHGIDDKATISQSRYRSSEFHNRIGRLPAYKPKTELRHVSPRPSALMHIDIAIQIKDDFVQMRLIIFEIAPHGSVVARIWGQHLKLGGPALELDKKLCVAVCNLQYLAYLSKIDETRDEVTDRVNNRLERSERLKAAMGKLYLSPFLLKQETSLVTAF